MSTRPAHTELDPGSITRTAPGFWSRLVQAFDDYLAERTKRTFPEVTLRRSKREIDRCRRLMREAAAVPNGARLHRVVQTRQRP
jgi:hypothetical protein